MTDLIPITQLPTGSINRITNGGFAFCPEGTQTVADGDTVFVSYRVLTQSGTVQSSQLVAPSDGQTRSIRITQTQATAQRVGLVQTISALNAQDLRNALISCSHVARFSASARTMFALLQWNGTADAAPTDPILNWDSTSYIPGQFFISSVQVLNYGYLSATAGDWREAPYIPFQGGSSLNNLLYVVWTETAVAQNGTLDLGLWQVVEGPNRLQFEHRPPGVDSAAIYPISNAMGPVVSAATRERARQILAATPSVSIFDYIDDIEIEDAIRARLSTVDVSPYLEEAYADGVTVLGFPVGTYHFSSSATIDNMTLYGEAPSSNVISNADGEYGRNGVVFAFTDEDNTPFLLGPNVVFCNIIAFWPDQLDSAANFAEYGGPIPYPPMIENASITSQVSGLLFINFTCLNAYEFADVGGDTPFDKAGGWGFANCRICAFNTVFTLNNVPEYVDLGDTEFGYNCFADEVNHFGNAGMGATIPITSLTRVGTTATASTAPLEHGLLTGQKATVAGATVDAATWNGQFVITVTGPSSYTYTMGGTPAASPAVGTITSTAFYLRDYVVTNGVGLHVNGDGSPTSRSTYSVDGVFHEGLWFGFAKALEVEGGTLTNSYINANFDACQQILHVHDDGAIAATAIMPAAATYLYKLNYTETATPPGIQIENPAPGPGLSPINSIDIGGAIDFSTGSLVSATGDYIDNINVSLQSYAFAAFITTAGTYHAVSIDAPAAFVSVSGRYRAYQASAGGVNRTGVIVADSALTNINGAQFQYCDRPIDITDTAGSYIISGCGSLNTGDTYSLNSATANIAAWGNGFDKRNYAVEALGQARVALAVNGIDIYGATAGNSPSIRAVGSDTNIDLTLTPKGTGINTSARPARVMNATAIPAGGTAGAGYTLSSVANFGVFFGSGLPTLQAAKGSLYLRSDGSTTNDRVYVNTDGATAWTAITTAT